MTYGSGAAAQAAELTGIRRTLRTVFPAPSDMSAAMAALLVEIDRACAERDAAPSPAEVRAPAKLALAEPSLHEMA